MGDFDAFIERLDRRYVRQEDPFRKHLIREHRDLMAFMQETKQTLRDIPQIKRDAAEAKKSSWRSERYLVGGLDDSGKYTLGLAAWIKILAILLGVVLAVWPIAHAYKWV